MKISHQTSNNKFKIGEAHWKLNSIETKSNFFKMMVTQAKFISKKYAVKNNTPSTVCNANRSKAQAQIYTLGFNAILLLIAFLLSAKSGFSQEIWKLEIQGIITENERPLSGTKITSSIDGADQEEVYTNAKGMFKICLKANSEYIIKISKLGGYITKSLAFDTRNVSNSENIYKNFTLSFDAELFKDIVGLDKSVLKDPFGKVSYDPTKKQFTEDIVYTRNAQFKLDQAIKAIEYAAVCQEKFRKIILNAEKNIVNDQLEQALINLKEAQQLKINDSIVRAKLEEVNALQKRNDLSELASKKRKEFDRLLNYGSMHIKNGNLTEAEVCLKKASDFNCDSAKVQKLMNELSLKTFQENEKIRIKKEAEERRIAFLEKARMEREESRLELIERLETRNSPLAESARTKLELDREKYTLK
jgi:hypothetical protein